MVKVKKRTKARRRVIRSKDAKASKTVLPPQRTEAHIVDTKSIKRVLNLIPDHWVVRDLSERDYGMDLQVEIFEKLQGMEHYESTGCLAHLQLKGTAIPITVTSDKTVNLSVPRKSLLYAERFPTPFFLVRVDVSRANAKSYFLWMQRYVSDVLDVEDPEWRRDDQEGITVRIPEHNILPIRIDKIEKASRRPKYIEELLEFSELYFHIDSQLDAIESGMHTFNVEVRENLVTWAKRLKNLRILLSNNASQVDSASIDKLVQFIRSFKPGKSTEGNWRAFQGRFNLDLLRSPLGLKAGEDFESENDGDTMY